MIRLTGVSKSFGGDGGAIVALDGIDLDIAPGEIFGVIGRSGAGKSTLLRTINLLERPTAGTVEVAGREMTALSVGELNVARRNIGMIFQSFNLLSSRSVYDNVALPLEIAGADQTTIAGTVPRLLELVGLDGRSRHYPAQLSGGQKQRVGIARALATKPKVLLCDEATSALDPETTLSILQLIGEVNRELGVTVVLITHEMAVVKEIARRVAVLDHGRIVEQGSAFEVLARPKTDTARALVGETMGHVLPPDLIERLQARAPAGTLLKVVITGQSGDHPVLSETARRFDIDFNLVHGRIEDIQGEPFGTIVLSAIGPAPKIAAAINYLTVRKVDVEVLGHVSANDRAVS